MNFGIEDETLEFKKQLEKLMKQFNQFVQCSINMGMVLFTFVFYQMENQKDK